MPHDIDPFQALVLAVVQGVTELFPLSSRGPAVILPHLFRWTIDQNSDTFLPFLVMLHVGTALALLICFWRDWWILLASLLPGDGPGGAAGLGKVESRRALFLLVLGTDPAGGVALVLPSKLAAPLFHLLRLPPFFVLYLGPPCLGARPPRPPGCTPQAPLN